MATTKISVKYQDAEGESKREAYHFDATDVTTVAEAQDAFTDFETLVHNCIGPAIVEADVTIPLTCALTETPDSGYSVWTGATLSFKDSDGVGKSLYLPGILQAMMQSKKVLNTTSPSPNAINLLIADIITNGFGTGAHRLSSYGSGALWNTYLDGDRSGRKP